MADPTRTASAFRSALTRLTGVAGHHGSHVIKHRIKVTTSDGREFGLILAAGRNAPSPPRKDIAQLKRKLCLREKGIDVATVLNDWGPTQLRDYIRKNLTYDDLNQRKG